MSETVDERIAARKQREESLRAQLLTLEFDGPHEIKSAGFDPVSAMFGGGPFCYAICLLCGAMVKLDDPIERDGVTVERGIGAHVRFHETITVPA